MSARSVSLPSQTSSGGAEFVLALEHAAVGSFALELTLLLTGLVETLRIRPVRGPKLQLTLIDAERVSKANVALDPMGATCFAIGRNQAQYLQAVLLRAYRDQIAEVNHIHIEGQNGGRLFDLTAMFELSASTRV